MTVGQWIITGNVSWDRKKEVPSHLSSSPLKNERILQKFTETDSTGRIKRDHYVTDQSSVFHEVSE